MTEMGYILIYIGAGTGAGVVGRIIFDYIRPKNNKYVPTGECIITHKNIDTNIEEIKESQSKLFGRVDDIWKEMPRKDGS